MTNELTDVELEAFGKHLSRIRHTLPEPARPFASNIINQIANYLAAEDDEQRTALRTLMMAQLVRLEMAKQA